MAKIGSRSRTGTGTKIKGPRTPCTLTEWVATFPSQRVAAAVVGVPEPTLNRWLKGALHPRGLSVRRLGDLGIIVENERVRIA